MKYYNSSKLMPGLFALGLFLTGFLTVPAAIAASSTGGEYHVILNGRSIHMTQPPKGTRFNESNFGSGVQYELNRKVGSKWVNYVTGSAFTDSFNRPSYYVGAGQVRRYKLGNGWHMDTGYVGFVMARQDVNNYQPFPGVLPVASIGTKRVALNMTYVPKLNEQFQELVFFQLKVSTEGW